MRGASWWFIGSIFSIVCLLSAVPCGAADGDVDGLRAEIKAMRNAYESRIADLESEVKELKTGVVQKSTNQAVDESLSKKNVVDKALNDPGNTPSANDRRAPIAVRTQAGRVVVGGYTEFSYKDRGDRTPEFSQDRTVFQFSSTLNERIRLYLEFEQETGATLEGAEENGAEFEVEQAYIDFSIHKAFNFRAGTMLVPIGRFNLYHEGFVNNFVDRPLVNRWVIPTTWYEEGVEFHGDPVDTKTLGINYELGLYNPAVASGASSDTGFREVRNEGASPEFNGKMGAMRVAFEPARGAKWFADSLEIGISGLLSNYRSPATVSPAGDQFPIARGALDLAAFDLSYEKKHFGFRTEAATAHVSAGGLEDRRLQKARGFYAEAFYSWKPCIFNEGPIAKSFKDPRLIFATRFDWIELNAGREDARDLKRVTAGVSFRPLSKTVIKLDYQMDFSRSGLTLDTIPDSGKGKRTDAILFGIATGF